MVLLIFIGIQFLKVTNADTARLFTYQILRENKYFTKLKRTEEELMNNRPIEGVKKPAKSKTECKISSKNKFF